MKQLLGAAVVSSIVAASVAIMITSGRVLAECETNNLTRRTTCWIQAPAAPSTTVSLGDGQTSAFVWTSVPYDSDDARVRLGYCMRTTVDGSTTTIQAGVTYIVLLRNAATGEPVASPQSVCVFSGDPAPEPPPPPPTQAEFIQAARRAATVETSLNPSPEIGGLTGLETWLWCVDPGVVQVGVALRGWIAEATLTALQYEWVLAGRASANRATDSCGSESSPAASWMPETQGAYSVTLTSTWAGSWTLQYNGVPAGSFPLGPFQFAAPTVAYPVGEYRGVLTPPGGSEP